MNLTNALSDFNNLKRNATCIEEVGSWFKENSQLLGPFPGGVLDDIKVYTSFKNMFDIFYDKDPDNKVEMTVCLKLVYPDRDTPGFLRNFNTTRYSATARQERWSFAIVVSEWSMLVADLASRYLSEHAWTSEHDASIAATKFLETHLTTHFPGMTLEKLISLVETGLLDDTSPSSLSDILFATRTSLGSLNALPTDVSPHH